MIVASRFEVPEGRAAAFEPAAQQVLSALAERPGFVRGRLGRAVDAPSLWSLVTEWEDVGSYRRGLSGYDVKVATSAVLEFAVNEPSAFEVVAAVEVSRPSTPGPAARAR
jgi:heme-degrading monooxygenase HmoA